LPARKEGKRGKKEKRDPQVIRHPQLPYLTLNSRREKEKEKEE